MAKQRWYSVFFLICIFLISVSIPFSLFIKNDAIVDYLNMALKVGFLVYAYFFIKKNQLGFFKYDSFQKKDLLLLPFILLCFINFAYVFIFNIPSISYDIGYIIRKIFYYLLVAISEEVVFRCVLLEEFRRYQNDFLSILYSSLIFGAIHLFNISSVSTIIPCLIQSVYAFAIGLGCGLIYVKGTNTLYPITFHFLFNVFNDTLVIALTTFSLDTVGFSYYLFVLVYTLIFVAYGIFVFYKKGD